MIQSTLQTIIESGTGWSFFSDLKKDTERIQEPVEQAAPIASPARSPRRVSSSSCCAKPT